MTETTEKSLEVLTIQEVEDNKRKEDRKRRNRESAAKCRQKLKDKLNTSQRVVTYEEYRNKALKNEIALVNIEYKKIMVVLRQHSNHCNLPNNYHNQHMSRNGINGHNSLTPNATASDINTNHRKDN